jgi:hypothetical protein
VKRSVAVSLANKLPLSPWWLVVVLVWEAFFWYMLLGVETDGMKPHIGQTGVLLIGSLLLFFAVIGIGVMVWIIIRLVRTRIAKRQLADIDKSQEMRYNQYKL